MKRIPSDHNKPFTLAAPHLRNIQTMIAAGSNKNYIEKFRVVYRLEKAWMQNKHVTLIIEGEEAQHRMLRRKQTE